MRAIGPRSERLAKLGTRGIPRPLREHQILAVAGNVFAQRGYHLASMDEIAERAGVSKPMIYAYFGSKEGLYLAYVEGAGAELLERMRIAAPRAQSADQRLRAGVAEFFRFVYERRDGWLVLYAEAAGASPLAAQIAELRARIAEVVSTVLAESDFALGHDEAALDGIAHAFVGAGESLANWWLARADVSQEAVVDLLMSLVA